MNRLRRSRSLRRLVAAWFALWIGAMLAAPVAAPAGVELVCSGGGFKLVTPDEKSDAHLSGHLGQCPACVHTAAPPPACTPRIAGVQYVALPLAAGAPRVLRAPDTPPPARGPPRLS